MIRNSVSIPVMKKATPLVAAERERRGRVAALQPLGELVDELLDPALQLELASRLAEALGVLDLAGGVGRRLLEPLGLGAHLVDAE